MRLEICDIGAVRLNQGTKNERKEERERTMIKRMVPSQDSKKEINFSFIALHVKEYQTIIYIWTGSTLPTIIPRMGHLLKRGAIYCLVVYI